MVTKKILFVVAHEGYQPIEYLVPKKLIDQAGFTIVTTSNKPGTATATDGTTTLVDVMLDAVVLDDYDGIFFIGGPGSLEHLDNQTSYDLLIKADEAGMPIGAICASTRILAKSEILQGRKATGWNGDNKLPEIYLKYDVTYAPKEVVVDSNIITATGPNAAREYGERAITLLHDTSGWG